MNPTNPTPNASHEDIAKIADLIAPAIYPNAAPTSAAVRMNAQTRLVSLERFREFPSRMQRTVALLQASEFTAYVEGHTAEGDEGTGFAEFRPLRVRYVIDYGSGMRPRWGTHIAEFAPDYSPAFEAWQAAHRRQMKHAEFAVFLEERLADIVYPDAATMLEVSTGFQASGTTSFSSAVRLQSGDVQFAYAREVRGVTKAGQVDVPSEFVIRVPLYEFHAQIELRARLRFRLNEGALAVWYEFVRLEDALAQYDDELLASIRARLPRILLGKVQSALLPVTMRDDQ